MVPLEVLDRGDGRYGILHPVKIEPVRSNCSPIASILMQPAHRNLRNFAAGRFPVHRMGRLFQRGIDEANDLTAEVCDKRDHGLTHIGAVLAHLSIAFRRTLERHHQHPGSSRSNTNPGCVARFWRSGLLGPTNPDFMSS